MTTPDGKVNWKIYAERPGLFHLPLNASKNPPVKQISHRIKVTEKLIRLFPSGFTNIASRNLLGVLCFYNGDFARAVKTFQEILQYQNDSLTALANLAFVYKRLKAKFQIDQLFRGTYKRNRREYPTDKVNSDGRSSFCLPL